MSWSVVSSGPAAKVAEQIDQQFSSIKMNDEGEQETVQRVRSLIAHTLLTFDPELPVIVQASGSMGFRNWTKKSEAHQSVSLKIDPILFSV